MKPVALALFLYVRVRGESSVRQNILEDRMYRFHFVLVFVVSFLAISSQAQDHARPVEPKRAVKASALGPVRIPDDAKVDERIFDLRVGAGGQYDVSVEFSDKLGIKHTNVLRNVRLLPSEISRGIGDRSSPVLMIEPVTFFTNSQKHQSFDRDRKPIKGVTSLRAVTHEVVALYRDVKNGKKPIIRLITLKIDEDGNPTTGTIELPLTLYQGDHFVFEYNGARYTFVNQGHYFISPSEGAWERTSNP